MPETYTITITGLTKEEFDRFNSCSEIATVKTGKPVRPEQVFVKMLNEYCARRRQNKGLEKWQELNTENILIGNVPLETALRFYDKAREEGKSLLDVFMEVMG